MTTTNTIAIRDLKPGQTLVFDDGPNCEVHDVQPVGGGLVIVDWITPEGTIASTAPRPGNGVATVLV